MNDDFSFLEYVYQSAKSEQENINRVIHTRNKKDEVDGILREINNNYKKISNAAKLMIERRKKEVKDISILSKMVTYMNIKKNIEKNTNSNEIKKWLNKNINAGIDELKKMMDDSKLKSKTIINLGNRYIDIENENLKKLENI